VKVIIFGPNLSQKGQALGDLHVHRDGCGDARRYGRDRRGVRPFGGDTEPHRFDVPDLAALVREFYPPSEFEYAPEDWQEFAGGFYVAPCVKWGAV
jgi:hypothetical protein